MSLLRRSLIAIFIFFICITVMMHSNIITPIKEMPIANYIIDNAYSETGAENAVTSVYLYYRYYDTLFEALMLMFSIIAVIYMSVHGGDHYDE
ncbi:MAG TPA: hypothetical protein DCS67_08545 [Clostridiales bacterium UBA8960]|nr:hypothetical protein [Clostridiales bacterium UBA8960]